MGSVRNTRPIARRRNRFPWHAHGEQSATGRDFWGERRSGGTRYRARQTDSR